MSLSHASSAVSRRSSINGCLEYTLCSITCTGPNSPGSTDTFSIPSRSPRSIAKI